MAIFNSYVCLPEDNQWNIGETPSFFFHSRCLNPHRKKTDVDRLLIGWENHA